MWFCSTVKPFHSVPCRKYTQTFVPGVKSFGARCHGLFSGLLCNQPIVFCFFFLGSCSSHFMSFCFPHWLHYWYNFMHLFPFLRPFTTVKSQSMSRHENNLPVFFLIKINDIKPVYLVQGDLQTEPPLLYQSPALDTPLWQTAGSTCHHIWCPTLHFSTPPLAPRLRWPHHGDEPMVAEDDKHKHRKKRSL